MDDYTVQDNSRAIVTCKVEIQYGIPNKIAWQKCSLAKDLRNVRKSALRLAEIQHQEKCSMAGINKQGRMQYGKTGYNDEKMQK
jgi:hypothetical protein